MPDEVSIADRRSLVRLFPALRLIGAIRQAFDLRKLIIAGLGLALVQPVWLFLDQLVPATADTTPDLFPSAAPTPGLSGTALWSPETLSGLHYRISEPFRLLATPLLAFVDPASSWGRTLHALASLLWLIIVWALCGGAIARIAIVQIAAMRQTNVIEALRFAVSKAGPLIMAPLCPLLGIALCTTIAGSFGLLYRLPAVGPALAGIALFVPIAAGLVMTLFLAGLLGGWPLLQAATAGGAEDALDALSRIFSYLNQRLGPYLFLVALAWLGGMLGLALVDLLTAGVVRLTQWGLSLTAPSAILNALFESPASSPAGIAGATHAFWLGLVRLVAHGWIHSFFWTAAAYLYLWLRHDIDGNPWSDTEPAIADTGSSHD